MLTKADIIELESLIQQEKDAEIAHEMLENSPDPNYFFDKAKLELSHVLTEIHLRKLVIYKKISNYEDQRVKEMRKCAE